ncbi:MAG TPA: HAMP domain-containing sensor histidine kinase [Caulobacteraceae bacterium]|jgi:signal transduction histidine kinase|nr:HAMP domain-containing sensor histidine kinase [Caulobacteraceae bacterium]
MSQALPKGRQASAPEAPASEAHATRPRAVATSGASQAPVDAAPRSFLRMVSHELRTPLNAIIGFSEIISSEMCGPIPAQYREYGEIIRVSGHRLLKLVNQVLEIVKLESGQVELDPRAEPIDALFAEAAHACSEELEHRRVKIDIETPIPAPSALADARAARTALVCLIQNAAQYAPEGSTVRLVGRAQGPLVQLSVIDAGEGLDPAETPRLMRAFEQGENALVRRVEGAGLGWPLVDLICKTLGGTFEIDTAPGRGLCATISLRRAG